MTRIVGDGFWAGEAYIPVSDRTRPVWEKMLAMSAEEYQETVIKAAVDVLAESGQLVPAALHNDLERLADIARHEIEASRGSVAAGFSAEAREACAAITARLVTAGVDGVTAEQATTAWILLRDRAVWECVQVARGGVARDETDATSA